MEPTRQPASRRRPRPLAPVARWSRASQETARRNAMAATTALLQRRAERLEVHAFIQAALTQRTATPPPATTPSLPGPRRGVG